MHTGACTPACIHTHTQSILGTLTTQQILTGFMTAHTHNLLGSTSGKEPACPCRRHKRHRFDPWLRKIPRRREWQFTPIFLPGESHGQRSLTCYVPGVAKSRTQLKQLSISSGRWNHWQSSSATVKLWPAVNRRGTLVEGNALEGMLHPGHPEIQGK